MGSGINVIDLLGEYFNIQPKKASRNKGGEYHSACPRCAGENCFHVWPEQNEGEGSYWCRKCDKTGDNVEFLVEFAGMEYPEAFQCAGRSGEARPKNYKLKSPGKHENKWEPTEHLSPEEKWQEKAMEFVERANEELLKYSLGLKWYESRGINKDTVRKYKLGYNPDNMWRHPKSWGLPEELKENGKPKMHYIPSGLVIPCIVNDKVCRLRIRRKKADYQQDGRKYYVVKGSKSNTMMLCSDRDVFVIVEAELDAMAIVQAAGDLVGAVALGSISTRPDAVTTEILRSCMRILNALDYEPGSKGQKYSLGALAWWGENFPNCRRWPVPVGKDPGDLVQAGGNMREWIESGLPPAFQFRRSAPSKQPQKPDSIRANVPKEILELEKLLAKTRVAIINTPDHYGLGEEGYARIHRNWGDFSRMSDLMFHTECVFEYLTQHPADVITSKNLIYGRTAE